MFKFLSALLFVAVVFSACGEDKKVIEEDVTTVKTKQSVVITEEKPSKEQVIDEVASKLKLSASKTIDKAAVLAKDISSSSKEVIEDMKEKSSVIAQKSLTSVKEVSKSVSAEVGKKITSAVDVIMQKKKEEASLNIDAKQLYMKCAGCHGQKAEKSALNKSQVIQNWSSSKLAKALNGYKNDTYGGMMKGLMKSQVSSLSATEIKLLADYISTLK